MLYPSGYPMSAKILCSRQYPTGRLCSQAVGTFWFGGPDDHLIGAIYLARGFALGEDATYHATAEGKRRARKGQPVGPPETVRSARHLLKHGNQMAAPWRSPAPIDVERGMKAPPRVECPRCLLVQELLTAAERDMLETL